MTLAPTGTLVLYLLCRGTLAQIFKRWAFCRFRACVLRCVSALQRSFRSASPGSAQPRTIRGSVCGTVFACTTSKGLHADSKRTIVHSSSCTHPSTTTSIHFPLNSKEFSGACLGTALQVRELRGVHLLLGCGVRVYYLDPSTLPSDRHW